MTETRTILTSCAKFGSYFGEVNYLINPIAAKLMELFHKIDHK